MGTPNTTFLALANRDAEDPECGVLQILRAGEGPAREFSMRLAARDFPPCTAAGFDYQRQHQTVAYHGMDTEAVHEEARAVLPDTHLRNRVGRRTAVARNIGLCDLSVWPPRYVFCRIPAAVVEAARQAYLAAAS
jgi:hypothetical protein